MNIGNNLEEFYGIEFLTFDEEARLPDAAKQTRRHKIETIDMVNELRRYLDTIESRARQIPELNEQWHADLVLEFRNEVKDMQLAAERAIRVGRI